LALVACDGDDPPPSPCASVTCEAGSYCNEADATCHCGAPEGPICGEAEICEASECVPELPAAVCDPRTAWAPGAPIFREVTSEWGLTGVEAVRLSVVDLDGDPYPDLVARRGGFAREDRTEAGVQRVWVLRRDATAFTDVSDEAGLWAMRTTSDASAGRPVDVIAFADVDNDGDSDAYFGMSTYDPAIAMGEKSEIFLNDGSGHFTIGPESAIRSTEIFDVPAGASFVDYDRDGNVDLWVPQHNFTPPGSMSVVFMQSRLYRGDGTGAFSEVTETAGVLTEDWRTIATLNAGRSHARAWASAACDLNADGTPELLAPSYGRAPNHLFQGAANETGVTFVNRSVASGFAYDSNMSWQDNQFARCFCQANRTAAECADVPAPQIGCAPNWNHDQDREPFRLGGNSGAVRCYDVDNDGDLDLLTSEIRHWWAGTGADGAELLVNSGEADVRFDRPGNDATGLAIVHTSSIGWDEGHMTNLVFDFDNDGWADVYIGASDYPGNRGHLFRQTAPLSFTEVETTDFFEHNRSHGAVVADFDRDGDLDVVVGHSRARCDAGGPNDCYATEQVRAFENVLESGNFVQLRLRGGEGTNRAAIGARVTVSAGDLSQTQEIEGGHGHYGTELDPTLHFGIGDACEVEVTVRWPDAALTTETFTLPAGHRFEIAQGEHPRAIPNGP
jgi:hypothetical protein